jgi:hypothetical protein
MQRRLIYIEPTSITRVEAERVFRAADTMAICHALVGVTFHDPDRQWVEEWCLTFCESPDPELRQLAATCLGHLARIHRSLDLERVLPVLRRLSADPLVSGSVDTAMDDIEQFLGL